MIHFTENNGIAFGLEFGGYTGKKLAERGEKKKDSITGEQSIGGRPHEEGQSHGEQSTDARESDIDHLRTEKFSPTTNYKRTQLGINLIG